MMGRITLAGLLVLILVTDAWSTKASSHVGIVKSIAGDLGNDLAGKGKTPNYSVWTRITHGWGRSGTCEDCSEKLKKAFADRDIPADQVFDVFAESDGWGPNRNHMTVGVMIDGKPYVFDLWYHGKDTGSFKDFDKSGWNGMPLKDWGDKMKKEGYDRFGINAGDNQPDVDKALKQYRDKLAQEEAQRRRVEEFKKKRRQEAEDRKRREEERKRQQEEKRKTEKDQPPVGKQTLPFPGDPNTGTSGHVTPKLQKFR